MIYPTGTAYILPDNFTWSSMIEQRNKWGIDILSVPLVSISGVCVAWGRLLPSNYAII